MGQEISLQEFIQKFSSSQQSSAESLYSHGEYDTGEVIDAIGEIASLALALDASQQGVAQGTACTQIAKEGKSYIIEISRSFWDGQAYGQMSIDIKKDGNWEDLYSIEEQGEYEIPFDDIIKALTNSSIDIGKYWRGDISSSLDNPSYYS